MTEHATEKDRLEARRHLEQLLGNCRQMMSKFPEKGAQHTLLVNRIQALEVSRKLILGEQMVFGGDNLNLESIREPILSILRKTSKALDKAQEGSPHEKRLMRIIRTMKISLSCLEDANQT